MPITIKPNPICAIPAPNTLLFPLAKLIRKSILVTTAKIPLKSNNKYCHALTSIHWVVNQLKTKAIAAVIPVCFQNLPAFLEKLISLKRKYCAKPDKKPMNTAIHNWYLLWWSSWSVMVMSIWAGSKKDIILL